MAPSNPLLLAFYGDDFTGSTDALESVARCGAKAALFIAPPTPAQLARREMEGLQAVGVAGMTRSMTPEAMEAELSVAFAALKGLGAPHVHYKVCSTFDSSPTIGSIGRAIDVGAEVFGLGGSGGGAGTVCSAPGGSSAAGRYCVFGNLFARLGIGSARAIYRLDRHPSMSQHPVTPADEGDLRVHLARQTRKRIGLLDVLQVSRPVAEARAALEDLLADSPERPEIVLFDVLHAAELERLGALLDGYADGQTPLFSAGSSGIEMALGAHWAKEGRLNPVTHWPDPGRADPLLVLSGSCSPVTAGQIDWALAHGFAEVALDTRALAESESGRGSSEKVRAMEDATAAAAGHLQSGRSVILHTSRGAGDERLAATAAALAAARQKESAGSASARLLGGALGLAARGVLERLGGGAVRRVVVAGGDTSSYAARALGIESVEMIAPLTPGAPLCRACAPGSPLDGAEVNFKGGQVGPEDYFAIAARGRT